MSLETSALPLVKKYERVGFKTESCVEQVRGCPSEDSTDAINKTRNVMLSIVDRRRFTCVRRVDFKFARRNLFVSVYRLNRRTQLIKIKYQLSDMILSLQPL